MMPGDTPPAAPGAPSTSIVVLGLDPGLAALGYGVVVADRTSLVVGRFGVMRTERQRGIAIGRDLAIRVGKLATALGTLVADLRPNEASIEEFRFFGKSVTSSLQVANVVGMLREVLRARGIPTSEYSAQAIKRAVTGDGNADKAAVQRMVQLRLRLRELPTPDHAADALAAALTHAARLALVRRGVASGR
jgi:crossover junction endodeoxyribonuclease RuvC